MSITKEIEEQILQKVKSIRPGCVRVEIGRKAFFESHCNQKMIQVRVFYDDHETPGKEKEGTDEYVCPKCFETKRPLSDFESNSLANM